MRARGRVMIRVEASTRITVRAAEAGGKGQGYGEGNPKNPLSQKTTVPIPNSNPNKPNPKKPIPKKTSPKKPNPNPPLGDPWDDS